MTEQGKVNNPRLSAVNYCAEVPKLIVLLSGKTRQVIGLSVRVIG